MAADVVCRPYDPADRQAALRLLLEWRVAQPARLGRYPTVWRLDQLLTTRMWCPERDACVWQDAIGATGQLRALATLWSRQPDSPHLGLELLAAPGHSVHALEDQALRWVNQRAAERSGELGARVTVSAGAYDDEPERAAALERHGFAHIEAYNAYMARWLDDLPAAPALLPAGYTMRQVNEEDQPAYTALFERVFAPMTPEHRCELLRSPNYLHLAALAPDGAFTAFCELSWSREEWSLGGPRYAWVDYIGTDESHQRLGLAQALLYEGMRRLRTIGAERVALITMGSNERARSVYRRVGFYFAERDAVFTREVAWRYQ